jgi:DNA-binding XRE family transcriptional regulator
MHREPMAHDTAFPFRLLCDARGNYPAAEALQVSIARSIVRGRRKAGLTQVELARLAGIRTETLNRIEKGKHAPSVATIEKIERVFAKK